MFQVGEIIDRKYRVSGICSNAGGMGTVLFVKERNQAAQFDLVLKYCKDTQDEYVKRFRREVRILAEYVGNSKVVNVVDHNLDYDPPYFVMKYYPDGDLLRNAPKIRKSLAATERVFLQMIDAIQELHSRDQFHRDIKPQNFLCDGDNVLVSDFGLSTELGSETAFTQSSAFWGTRGYIPPEFMSGGFKHADASGDIFMLGKTMYVILAGKDPMYLIGDDIPGALFHVIERSCSIAKAQRYQSLAQMRQSVVSAFDVILNRGGGVGKAKQMLSAITDRLQREQKYSGSDIQAFVEQLSLLDVEDQIKTCYELPKRFFGVIAQKTVQKSLGGFLTVYEKLVEGQAYSWSYAETIADNMKVIFTADEVSPPFKAKALDLAIRGAVYMNRFAAMGTCIDMVTSVKDESLGMLVANLIEVHKHTFLGDIEPSQCGSSAVARMLIAVGEEKI